MCPKRSAGTGAANLKQAKNISSGINRLFRKPDDKLRLLRQAFGQARSKKARDYFFQRMKAIASSKTRAIELGASIKPAEPPKKPMADQVAPKKPAISISLFLPATLAKLMHPKYKAPYPRNLSRQMMFNAKSALTGVALKTSDGKTLMLFKASGGPKGTAFSIKFTSPEAKSVVFYDRNGKPISIQTRKGIFNLRARS